MKNIKNNILAFLAIVVFLTACNKNVEQFAPLATPTYPSGSGIAATLASNPNYSMYSALISRAGMAATLNDSTKTFTLFATDNNGMKAFVNAASGGAVPLAAPDATFLGFISSSLSAASAAGIVQYNTVGQKLLSSAWGSSFPNYPFTSQIILDATQPFIRMPIFPEKGSPYSYVNNLPVTAVDMAAANGIIHTVYSVVAPPTATLKAMIAAEPTLSYFRAAIARGDSGSVGLSKIDSLLGYGVTNMTILTPNDAALQPVLFGAIYQGVYPTVFNTVYTTAYNAAIAGGATATQAAAIATTQANTQTPGIASAQATSLSSTPSGFNLLPVATVQGIVAYHVLASAVAGGSPAFQPNIRAFSPNFSSTPSFVKTLVNNGYAPHPGIMTQATFTGPSVTALKFTGYANPSGGNPFSAPAVSAIKMDNHAVNGVYHIINGVLLPQ